MLTVGVLVLDLEGVIGEMGAGRQIGLVAARLFQESIVVLEVTAGHLVDGVGGAAGAEVARLVEVEVEAAVGDAPHSDVELAALVEQRPLEVLLDHPVRELQRGLDKASDVGYLIKDFDTLALILVGRLHQPDVLLAVLLRQVALDSSTAGDLLVMTQKLVVLMRVQLRRNDVTCRHRLEDGKVLLDIGYRSLVVILETAQEACLGGYFFVPV